MANLISEEGGDASDAENKKEGMDLETARTHLMQYGYNVTQLLVQILHNEDHIAPFVAVNGFDALLDMARWTVTPYSLWHMQRASVAPLPVPHILPLRVPCLSLSGQSQREFDS